MSKEVRIQPGRRKGPNDFFKAIALVITGVLIAFLIMTCIWLWPEITFLQKKNNQTIDKTQPVKELNEDTKAVESPTTSEQNDIQENGAISNPEEDAVKSSGLNQTNALFDYSLSDCQVTYIKHELSTDYDGNPCLILYYTYTNKSDEPKSAMGNSCYIKAYQNGIECDPATIPFDVKNTAIDNHLKNIMPGISLEVAEAFKISDKSDVTLILTDIFDILGDSPTATATLSLTQ